MQVAATALSFALPALLALAPLGACDKDPTTRACQPGGDPTLEIGVGIGEYTALPSDDAFPLVHGPQGGYHLEIGLAATHIDASSLLTGHLEGTLDGRPFATLDPWLDFRCTGDALTSWGTKLIYDAPPDVLDGQQTTLTAEITDLEGATVRATKTVRIVWSAD